MCVLDEAVPVYSPSPCEVLERRRRDTIRPCKRKCARLLGCLRTALPLLMSDATPVETEIKLRLDEPHSITDRILAAGFTIHRERVFEANNVYDTPGSTLRTSGQLLRLREAGDVCTLTWKGPARSTGGHKSRPEVETSVGDARIFAVILGHLGYSQRFRYEKFRTEFARPGEPGVITLDETPIGWFVELEGEPSWIDTTASQLGFDRTQYVTASYSTLYLEHCRNTGQQPGWMVFSDPA